MGLGAAWTPAVWYSCIYVLCILCIILSALQDSLLISVSFASPNPLPPPPQLPHPINKLMALSTPYLLMKRKGSIQEVYCVTKMLIWLMVYGTNVQYQPHSDLKWFVKFLKSSTKKVTRGERIRVSVTCSWENFKYSKRKKKPKWNMS